MKNAWKKVQPHLEFLDLALAAVLGLVFTVLGVLNLVGGETIAQAAIALLALLAFSLLRERRTLERLDVNLQQVDVAAKGIVEAVRKTVGEMLSDHSYHTKSLTLAYDLIASDGSHAVATKTRQIRFTRNNVLSIHDRHRTDGELQSHEITGGPVSGPHSELPQLEGSRDTAGRPLNIVSLKHPRKVGEVMEVITKRQLKNSFTDESEYVKYLVDAPTDEVVFDITWPNGTPPSHLTLDRQGIPTGIPLARLQDEAGRARLVEKVVDPKAGETITLSWQWAPTANTTAGAP